MKRSSVTIILIFFSFVTQNLFACYNYPPVAVINQYVSGIYPHDSVIVGRGIYLDGESSYDNDGVVVDYNWIIPSAATNVRKTDNDKRLFCTFNNPGSYRFFLNVKDNDGTYSGYDTIDILVVDGDTTPPSPNPITWLVPPRPVSKNSVSMTANVALDESGVEYYFTCTSGSYYGGNDSGWQDSPIYEDSGLRVGVNYSYTVKARDKSPQLNETASSTTSSTSIHSIIYVDPDSDSTSSDGESWDTAYHTIQEGLTNAVDNDVVIVRAFKEYTVSSLDFGGKAIVLANENPWIEDSLVLKSNGDSIIIFDENEGPDSVINGFTISKGSGNNRAILCQSASPTFYNCKFTNNLENGTIKIENDISSKNVILEMFDCKFINNSLDYQISYPDYYGHCIYFKDTSDNSNINILIQNCDFIGNFGDGSPINFGVFSTSSGVYNIKGCNFESNIGSVGVARFSVNLAYDPEININFDDCKFNNNRGYSHAGVILGTNVDNVKFSNCAFTKNKQDAAGYHNGATIFLAPQSLSGREKEHTNCLLENCIFAYNSGGDLTYSGSTENDHSAIYVDRYNSISIENNLFYENTNDIGIWYDGLSSSDLLGEIFVINSISWRTGDGKFFKTCYDQTATLFADNCAFPETDSLSGLRNSYGGYNNYIIPEFYCSNDMDGLDDILFTEDDGFIVTTQELSGIGYGPTENDVVPPTPNPVEWDEPPYPLGLDSIAMRASSVYDDVDNDGVNDPGESYIVEYYFKCTEGGGHDSGWQQSRYYKDTNLVSGREYTYIVMARDKSIYKNVGIPSLPGNTKTYTEDEIPLAPGYLTATVVSNTQINLSWIDGGGYIYVDGFDLERRIGSGEYEFLASVSGIEKYYSDSTCSSITQYQYRIVAKNNAGESGYTNSIVVTTLAPAPVIPITPTNLTGTVDSDTQITLYWNDTSSDEYGFKIEYNTDGTGIYQELANVGEDVESYVHSGCSASTTYYYRVCSWNSAGDSVFVTAAPLVTDSLNSPTLPEVTSLNILSDTEVEIIWEDNSDNEDGFYIERKEGDVYVNVGEVGSNITSFTDTDYDSAYGYIYRIVAFNQSGSSYSISSDNVPGYEPPVASTNLSANINNSNPYSEIVLSWNPVGTSNTYNIYRSDNEGFIPNLDSLIEDNYASTSYVDINLAHSTSYYYIVRAVSENGIVGDYDSFCADNCSTQVPLDAVAPYFATSPWNSEQILIDSTSLSLNVNTASDEDTPIGIRYSLQEVSGQEIRYGYEIDWQEETEFNITGLKANTNYSFAVQAMDAYGNISEQSEFYHITTLSWDVNAPEFTNGVWAITPYSLDAYTIAMKAQYAIDDDPSSVEYQFNLKKLNGDDIISSQYQSVRDYSMTGLEPGTVYECWVCVRDGYNNINETNSVLVTTQVASNSLQVIIKPNSAVEAGCKWRIYTDDEEKNQWLESGYVLDDLSISTHEIEFYYADGWDVATGVGATGTISYINTGSGASLEVEITKGYEQEGYIYVPKDISTLGSAVETAQDGDTIILSPGRYVISYKESIEVSDKSLTIRSANPSDDCQNETTIIFCNNIYKGKTVNVRAFSLDNCLEGDGVTFSGITFKSGSHKKGGIIFAKNSKVNINYCNFIGNMANNGGAIYTNSDINIEKSNFEYNSIRNSSGFGGAVCLVGDSTYSHISSCSFRDNSAHNGGAIYCIGKNSTVVINETSLEENESINGGAIYFRQNELYVNNSSLSANNASISGGAIFVSDGYLDVSYSEFADCSADKKGGAIYIDKLGYNISNSIFMRNQVTGDGYGGAIYALNCKLGLADSSSDLSTILYKCIFKNNDIGRWGEGSDLYQKFSAGTKVNSSMLIDNCQFVDSSLSSYACPLYINNYDLTMNNTILTSYAGKHGLYVDKVDNYDTTIIISKSYINSGYEYTPLNDEIYNKRPQSINIAMYDSYIDDVDAGLSELPDFIGTDIPDYDIAGEDGVYFTDDDYYVVELGGVGSYSDGNLGIYYGDSPIVNPLPSKSKFSITPCFISPTTIAMKAEDYGDNFSWKYQFTLEINGQAVLPAIHSWSNDTYFEYNGNYSANDKLTFYVQAQAENLSDGLIPISDPITLTIPGQNISLNGISEPASPESMSSGLNVSIDQFTGSASYSFPITVPPARHGSQPKLSLNYNSRGGNGWAGVGWSVPVSSIQRNGKDGVPVKWTGDSNPSGAPYGTFVKPANYYDEDKGFTISFGAVNGDLVKTIDKSSTSSEPDVYFAEVESLFMKYEFYENENYWTATDKSGNKYFFGKQSNSKMIHPQFTAQQEFNNTYMWLLTRIIDVNGNTTIYNYYKDFESSEDYQAVYIESIEYNGSDLNKDGDFGDTNEISPMHKVEFINEIRDDKSIGFGTGYRVTSRKRLSEIVVKTKDFENLGLQDDYYTDSQGFLEVRSYKLNHEYSPSTLRSLLKSVIITGHDRETSFEPVTFEYSEKEFAFEDTVDWGGLDNQGNTRATRNSIVGIGGDFDPQDGDSEPDTLVTMMDVNRDGLPDRLMVDVDRGNVYKVQYNKGCASETDSFTGIYTLYGMDSDLTGSYKTLGMSRVDPPYQKTKLSFFDIDGNGFPDRIIQRDGAENFSPSDDRNYFNIEYGKRTLSEDTYFDLSSLTSGNENYRWGPLFSFYYLNSSDQIKGLTRLSNAITGSLSAAVYEEGPRGLDGDLIEASGVLVHMADINGDGYPDRIIRDRESTAHFVQFNTGNGFKRDGNVQDWGESFIISKWGDIYIEDSQPQKKWSSPTLTSGGADSIIELIDINGDGLPDRVMRPKSYGTEDCFYVQFNTGYGFELDDIGQPKRTKWYGVNSCNQNTSNFKSIQGITKGSDCVIDMFDINGDGLPDRIIRNDYEIYKNNKKFYVELNTGTGFVDAIDGKEITWGNLDFQGFNGDNEKNMNAIRKVDGLLSWNRSKSNTRISMMDIDGNGLIDRVMCDEVNSLYQTSFKVQLNKGVPDVLKTVHSRLGGRVEIGYDVSTSPTKHKNRKQEPSDITEDGYIGKAISELAAPILTATTLKLYDGMSDINGDCIVDELDAVITAYEYEHGRYDYDRKQMCGFGKVTVVAPSGIETVTYYHQNGGVDFAELGEYDDNHFAKVGNPFRVETWGSDGQLYSLTVNQVNVEDLGNSRYYPYTKGSINISFADADGINYDPDNNSSTDTNYIATASANLSYDFDYGNPKESINYGEVRLASDWCQSLNMGSRENPNPIFSSDPEYQNRIDALDSNSNDNIVTKTKYIYEADSNHPNYGDDYQSLYIVGKPIEVEKYIDLTNDIYISHKKIVYDSSLTEQTIAELQLVDVDYSDLRGNVTQTWEYVKERDADSDHSDESDYVISYYGYDVYGSKNVSQDILNTQTLTYYDTPTHTHPVAVCTTNGLYDRISYSKYDLATGKVLSSCSDMSYDEDMYIVTRNVYDPLYRLKDTYISGEAESYSSPDAALAFGAAINSATTLWTNHFDWNYGGVSDTNSLNFIIQTYYGFQEISYYDGLGRVIQNRSKTPDNSKNDVGVEYEYLITDIHYDYTGVVDYSSVVHTGSDWLFGDYWSSLSDGQGTTTVKDDIGRVSEAIPPVGDTDSPTGHSYSDYLILQNDTEYISYNDTIETITEYCNVNQTEDAKGIITRKYTNAKGLDVLLIEDYGTNKLNLETRYVYDYKGYLRKIVQDDGTVIEYAYDSKGNITRTYDPDMGLWQYQYNYQTGFLEWQKDARGNKIENVYTYNGYYDIDGAIFGTKVFDSTGALAKETKYYYTRINDNGVNYSGYNTTDCRTYFGQLFLKEDYDQGQLVAAFKSGYDKSGRVVKSASYIEETGQWYTSSVQYSLNGQIITSTYPTNNYSNPSLILGYDYDPSSGNLRQLYDASDPTYNYWTVGDIGENGDSGYNENGQLKQITYGNGVSTNYTYYQNSKRTQNIYTSHPVLGLHQNLTYTYDELTNITNIYDCNDSGQDIVGVDSSALTNIQYDNLNRLETSVSESLNSKSSSTNGYRDYVYHNNGNIQYSTESGNEEYIYGNYQYTVNGFTYNQPHAVTQIGTRLFDYDECGNMTYRTTPDSKKQKLIYDELNQLIQVIIDDDNDGNFNNVNDGDTIVTFGYTNGGTRLWKKVKPADISTERLTNVWVSNSYEIKYSQASNSGAGAYRHLYHITGPTGLVATETIDTTAGVAMVYHTPLVANSISIASSVNTFLFKGGRLPLSVTMFSIVGCLTITFVSIRRKNHYGFAESYWYNTSHSYIFVRNPFRQVIVGTIMASLTLCGIPQQAFADPPQLEPLPSLVYYHGDHLGSVAVVTNGDASISGLALGEQVHRYVYSAFGKEDYTYNTYENVSNRFTGQQFDSETGLYYYNARYYDPEIGRFIQADTVLPGMDSQSLNRYIYCNNNPIKYVDPTGHFLGLPFIIASALASGITGGIQSADAGMGFTDGFGRGFTTGLATSFLSAGLAAAIGQTTTAAAMLGVEGAASNGLVAFGCSVAASGLMAAATGGDPGQAMMASAISVGIRGNSHVPFGSSVWFGQLLQAAGTNYIVGGVQSMIAGGSFRDGAEAGLLWGSTSFVLVSFFNTDVSWWDYTKAAARGFLEGAWDGLTADDKTLRRRYGDTVTNVTLGARYTADTIDIGLGAGAIIKGGAKYIAKKAIKEFGDDAIKHADEVADVVRQVGCFTAGTLIATYNRYCRIEDIESGDVVWAFDTDIYNRSEKETVTQISSFSKPNTIILIMENISIEVTDDHPLWVHGKGWTMANELKSDDVLVTVDGTKLEIKEIN